MAEKINELKIEGSLSSEKSEPFLHSDIESLIEREPFGIPFSIRRLPPFTIPDFAQDGGVGSPAGIPQLDAESEFPRERGACKNVQNMGLVSIEGDKG